MNDFIREIEAADTICILGHIRPDGDCVGSCLGIYNYILDNYPDKCVDIYLDDFKREFMFLRGADKILHEKQDKEYELCISVDSGDLDRHGDFLIYFHQAKRTMCIDHHISNVGFGDVCFLKTDCSAAAEAIFTLLDEDKIGQECAECYIWESYMIPEYSNSPILHDKQWILQADYWKKVPEIPL